MISLIKKIYDYANPTAVKIPLVYQIVPSQFISKNVPGGARAVNVIVLFVALTTEDKI